VAPSELTRIETRSPAGSGRFSNPVPSGAASTLSAYPGSRLPPFVELSVLVDTEDPAVALMLQLLVKSGLCDALRGTKPAAQTETIARYELRASDVKNRCGNGDTLRSPGRKGRLGESCRQPRTENQHWTKTHHTSATLRTAQGKARRRLRIR
jgi:hypothetical protein